MGRHIVRGTIPWQGSKVEDSQAAPAKAKAAPNKQRERIMF